jgi:formylglycine-generating enzyme required for sulfatase activity
MRRAILLLIAVLATLVCAPAAFAEKRVALVIGNGAYANATQLPNPKNDAEDVAAALKREGFETIVGIDLDQAKMQDTAIDFARAAREADVALFYYSGHAMQFGGVNYLMPVDAKLTDEADLRRMARVDDILADLQQAKNLRILILDACRDNPFAEQLKRSVGLTRAASVQRGLAHIDTPQGMIVAFSTQAQRTAEDGTGRNSPYTGAFLKHIEEPEEIGRVFRRISTDVYETTGHRQLPELSLSMIGEYYLRGEVGVASPSAPAPAQPSLPAPASDPALDAWNAAKDTDNTSVLEAFISKFGDSFYASLAKAKLEELLKKTDESKLSAVAPPVSLTRPNSAEPGVVTAPNLNIAPQYTPAETAPSPELEAKFEKAEACIARLACNYAGCIANFVGGWHDVALERQVAARVPQLEDHAAALCPKLAELRKSPEKTKVAVVAPPAPPVVAAKRVEPAAVKVPKPEAPSQHKPGDTFKDCDVCPEMVVVPAGEFMMGSKENEHDGRPEERPRHKVTIVEPFAVGMFSVTFDEWDSCARAGGCHRYHPSDEGWGRARRPVVNVSWNDAQAYVSWLSKQTGKKYRLLSETEREYVTRAGTTTPFWWGQVISPEKANYNGHYSFNGGPEGSYRKATVPVDSFEPNAWKVYQLHGNVWDWVEDCWSENYASAPSDGSAQVTHGCELRVIRGGSWMNSPNYLRAAGRQKYSAGTRAKEIGFRVARTL